MPNIYHPGAVVYLVSCPTWAVVQPGQLSYLGSSLPGQLSPWQLSAWAVVAWAVVLAPGRQPSMEDDL